MRDYLREAAAADGAWAAYSLPAASRANWCPPGVLRQLALPQAAGLPEWLFEESYQAVGDLAGDASRYCCRMPA